MQATAGATDGPDVTEAQTVQGSGSQIDYFFDSR